MYIRQKRTLIDDKLSFKRTKSLEVFIIVPMGVNVNCCKQLSETFHDFYAYKFFNYWLS